MVTLHLYTGAPELYPNNPSLTLYKLLNILASLPLSASNCVQFQGI